MRQQAAGNYLITPDQSITACDQCPNYFIITPAARVGKQALCTLSQATTYCQHNTTKPLIANTTQPLIANTTTQSAPIAHQLDLLITIAHQIKSSGPTKDFLFFLQLFLLKYALFSLSQVITYCQHIISRFALTLHQLDLLIPNEVE